VTPDNDAKDMGNGADIWHADALPAGRFSAWRVCFALTGAALSDESLLEELVALIREAGTVENMSLHGTELPPEAFRHLATIDTLVGLDLTACSTITRDTIPHLFTCKRLTQLRIGDTPMPLDPAVVEKLRALMPACSIREN